jgi:hypothetical protein
MQAGAPAPAKHAQEEADNRRNAADACPRTRLRVCAPRQRLRGTGAAGAGRSWRRTLRRQRTRRSAASCGYLRKAKQVTASSGKSFQKRHLRLKYALVVHPWPASRRLTGRRMRWCNWVGRSLEMPQALVKRRDCARRCASGLLCVFRATCLDLPRQEAEM